MPLSIYSSIPSSLRSLDIEKLSPVLALSRTIGAEALARITAMPEPVRFVPPPQWAENAARRPR